MNKFYHRLNIAIAAVMIVAQAFNKSPSLPPIAPPAAMGLKAAFLESLLWGDEAAHLNLTKYY